MPFKSEAQRRYLWANEPEIARDWADTYGSRIQKANGGSMQGGVQNYLGEQKEVTAPLKWQSSPDHPTTELAYITEAEKDLLVKQDLHNSLKGGVNRGPSGIMSLNGWGSSDDSQNRAGGDISGGMDKSGSDAGWSSPGGGGGKYNTAKSGAELSLLAGQKGSSTVMPGTGPIDKPNFIEHGMNLYKKYGLIPNAIRFGQSLFTPKTAEQKLQANIKKGYDVHNPAEMHGLGTRRPPVLATSGGGDGQQQQYYPPWFDDAYAQNILEDEELDIDTSSGDMEDWVQRFRVKDPYRQDRGALDEQIKERISKLYT